METGARIVIAGGSGFIGNSLASYLSARGYAVTVLARHPPRVDGSWDYVPWDARHLDSWHTCLERAEGLINLVGRSVDCVKTPDHIDEILRSRVEATRVLGLAVRAVTKPPPIWIQMSTAHIYGDPPRATCTENSPLGLGLAPAVGRAWEQAFSEALLPQQRGVVLRTSFVIGRDRGAGGGALARLRLLTKLGLGGRVGSGSQGMSWIHEQDLNRLFEQALQNPNMSGTFIASAPKPVAQVEFMRLLRRQLKVPLGLPAPAWLVRLGATLVLRTDPELALYGRYVSSSLLADAGFQFEFPTLEGALRDLLS